MSKFSELDEPHSTGSAGHAGPTGTPSAREHVSPGGGAEAGETKRLADARVFLLGKLTSMSRREAKQIIHQQGGVVVEQRATDLQNPERQNLERQDPERHGLEAGNEEGPMGDEREAVVTMVVVGDDVTAWRPLLRQQYPTIALGADSGRIELLQESEFWRRVGLIDSQDDVRRLYTPAMLGELLAVPASAIRRWCRQGTLVACRHVRRLPYFDFAEVTVARHLADLHKAGCSLRVIDRKLQELAAMMPDSRRPLAEVGVVVEGRQLFIRRGDDLEEPSGQRQFDFDRLEDVEGEATGDWQESIPLGAGGPPAEAASLLTEKGSLLTEKGSLLTEKGSLLTEKESSAIERRLPVSANEPANSAGFLSTLDRLQQEAIGHEDQGALDLAAESYRAILMAAGPSVEINFSLADVLYRQGDYAAARERYYMAIEMDEEYVEARANLGCVLAEMDELEMAVAAFQGALAYHADYADVHYHMAGTLDRMQQFQEAQVHWRAFLALAPESSWAEVARMRLAGELVEAVDGPSVHPEESRRDS